MTKQLSALFKTLLDQGEELRKANESQYNELIGRTSQHIDGSRHLNWQVRVRNLISKACGKESEHYVAFDAAGEASVYGTNYDRLLEELAVVQAAQDDYDGGFLRSTRDLVHAELAGSELEQAQELFRSGYIPAAAVVAGVVLETSLQALCDKHSVPHGKLDRMNADLAKVGEYNKLVQKQVTHLAALRNSAAHGEIDAFSTTDVESMLRDVENLVSRFLSGNA